MIYSRIKMEGRSKMSRAGVDKGNSDTNSDGELFCGVLSKVKMIYNDQNRRCQ